MDLIYHYCSLDTFIQIIKYKTIRLSDLNKTNDYLEKKWGLNLVRDSLIEELKNNNITMDIDEDYWYSESAHNHIEQLNNDLNMFLNHQTLISCFSLDGDQLGQWRAYAQDGAGVAIGFDYEMFKKMLKGKENLLIDKVIYHEAKQKNLIRENMFSPAVDYIRDGYKLQKNDCEFNDYFIEEFDTFCEILDVPTEIVFTLMKNPAFKEEKEVRIIYNTGIHEEMDESDLLEIINKELKFGKREKLTLSPIQYMLRNNKLVAYADLSFESCINNGIIKKVMIGPKCKASIHDIYCLMVANNFREFYNIEPSSASYC